MLILNVKVMSNLCPKVLVFLVLRLLHPIKASLIVRFKFKHENTSRCTLGDLFKFSISWKHNEVVFGCSRGSILPTEVYK